MSSESDPDEFFDAQDVTPAHERTSSMCSNDKILISSGETVNKVDQPAKPCPLLDLEEEEKRLLEIKKLTEERRRKEEEEIERKLAAIELRKLQELEKQRAEEKAAEYDERRKKLELMRLEVDSNNPSGLPLVKSIKHKSDLTGSVPEIEKSRSEPTILKRSSEAEDVLGLKAHSSSEAGEIVPSDTLTLFSENPQKSFMQVNDTINRNRPPNIEVDKVPQKHIPSIEISDCKEAPDEVTRGGENPGRGETPGSVFILEPDIVQSTKAGSLNRQGQLPPPRPVAPPRTRKQKGKSADMTSTNISASFPTKESDVVCGLPVGSDMQGSFHVTGLPGSDDAHPVLDIRSATKGDRVVTAAEDNSSLSAAPDELDSGVDVNKKLFAESSIPSDGLDPSQEFMSLKLGITGCGKNGEGYSIPLSMARPRSNSGSRYLSDKEILDQVFVLNLDTGETVPLSSAEEKLPRCINPLSLHIMRRTKEYSSDSNLYKGGLSDNESTKDPTELRLTKQTKQPGKKKMKIKKFFGKTVHKIKSVRAAHADESSSSDDELSEGRRTIKVKASHTHKGPYDFDLLVPVQELGGGKSNAVWTMKFSHCGRLLATGGQDNLLRVWVLKDAFTYFSDMRQKYNEAAAAASRVSPTPSQDSSTSQADTASVDSSSQPPEEDEECKGTEASEEEEEHMPFHKKPFCVYKGHTADLLDISWSKNYFILSSSMDKTVRLWHISRRECLCCFQHIDFVTAIAFHPKDDRYFLSGSLDGKLRLWNIPDKKVALWNEVSGTTKLITAANFCLNGRFTVVGTYDGRCVFYSTEQLKYFTQINVRSTRGRNARGRKITGVEPFPGEDKILVTSNDSRIRLYDLRDLTLTCKFKGCANNSSQIKASFSHDGKYIICGSEDHFVYIWKTQHDFYKFSSARRDRSDYWEGVKAHTAVVTNAIFAPNPILIIKPQFEFIDIDDKENSSGAQGEVLVSADYSGAIKIFINKFKPPS